MKDRVPRDANDLIEALRRHIKLLREYRRRGFDEGDRDYWGEIAAKLRLLLLPVGRNKPLLLLLLDKLAIDQNGIQVLSGITLNEFLNQSGIVPIDETGEFLPLTNAQLINVWATQHGAAHEDWTLTKAFDLLRPRDPGQTDLLRVAAAQLALIADAAVEAAEQVFALARGKEEEH